MEKAVKSISTVGPLHFLFSSTHELYNCNIPATCVLKELVWKVHLERAKMEEDFEESEESRKALIAANTRHWFEDLDLFVKVQLSHDG